MEPAPSEPVFYCALRREYIRTRFRANESGFILGSENRRNRVLQEPQFGLGRSCGRTFPLETFAAQYRTTLRRLERDSGFFAASGTGCARFHFLVEIAPASAGTMSHIGCALRLAVLATLRLVFELFIVEEELFACGKNEIVTAIHALQASVLEFHFPHHPVAWLYPLREDVEA
ncbi:MAG: hypothetical protein JWO13_2174 [Acidobacteriales bacterium]|nr:hypothetical protein [Terriglobales bacterium]